MACTIIDNNEQSTTKYVMYYGSGENPLRVVFDTKELFEETLCDMTENFLKDTLSRVSILTGSSLPIRKAQLLRLANVIFDRKISSIEDITDLMSIRIAKEKLTN